MLCEEARQDIAAGYAEWRRVARCRLSTTDDRALAGVRALVVRMVARHGVEAVDEIKRLAVEAARAEDTPPPVR